MSARRTRPGLRDLQAVESLRPILQAVLDTVSVPVLVKIAPDLSDEDVDAVADLAIELDLPESSRPTPRSVATV